MSLAQEEHLIVGSMLEALLSSAIVYSSCVPTLCIQYSWCHEDMRWVESTGGETKELNEVCVI